MSIEEFSVKQTKYVNIFSSGEIDGFGDERFVDGFFTVQYNRSAVKIQYLKNISSLWRDKFKFFLKF